jgi:hypothetical protein
MLLFYVCLERNEMERNGKKWKEMERNGKKWKEMERKGIIKESKEKEIKCLIQ